MAALSGLRVRPGLGAGPRTRERALDGLFVLAAVGVGAFGALAVAGPATSSLRTGGVLLTMAMVLGAAVAFAARRVTLTLGIAVVLLAVIPNYGLPSFPPRLVTPSLLVLWVVAATTLLRRAPTGMTGLDFCALAIFGGMLLAWLLGAEPTRAFLTAVWLWVGPYLAGRWMGRAGHGRTVLKVLVVGGLVAAPFAVLEIVHSNVFLHAFPNASDGVGVGVLERRFGRIRSQGAFGQPIPYAMFLSTVAVAAVGLWLTRPRHRSGLWTLAVAGVFVALMTTALARTGWIMLAVAAAVLVLFSLRALDTPRTRFVLVAGICIALVGLSLGPTRNLLFGGGEAATLQTSNDYRKGLLKSALTPGAIPTFGEAAKPGDPSIDNGYLLMALRWGYVPLAGMLLLLPACLALAWRHRDDLLSMTIYAITAALLVALFGVALMTQAQIFVFLMLGLAAGHGIRRRADLRWAARAARGVPAA